MLSTILTLLNNISLPLGGAVGKIFRIGKLPFNGQLGANYNVIRPEDIGPEYQIRAQIALLLPGK
jgi:hypothetical protein